jgi:hypothetical protein
MVSELDAFEPAKNSPSLKNPYTTLQAYTIKITKYYLAIKNLQHHAADHTEVVPPETYVPPLPGGTSSASSALPL